MDMLEKRLFEEKKGSKKSELSGRLRENRKGAPDTMLPHMLSCVKICAQRRCMAACAKVGVRALAQATRSIACLWVCSGDRRSTGQMNVAVWFRCLSAVSVELCTTARTGSLQALSCGNLATALRPGSVPRLKVGRCSARAAFNNGVRRAAGAS